MTDFQDDFFAEEVAQAIREDMASRPARFGVLEAAASAVEDRGLNYGKPENNFANIARLWNAHLHNAYGAAPTIRAHDVAIMQMLLKIARIENTPNHRDSYVDIAGYAACGYEIVEGK